MCVAICVADPPPKELVREDILEEGEGSRGLILKVGFHLGSETWLLAATGKGWGRRGGRVVSWCPALKRVQRPWLFSPWQSLCLPRPPTATTSLGRPLIGGYFWRGRNWGSAEKMGSLKGREKPTRYSWLGIFARERWNRDRPRLS